MEVEQVRYEDLIDFLGYLNEQDIQKNYLNRYIKSVEHYFRFKDLNIDLLSTLRIRNKRSRILIADILTDEQTKNLLLEYPTKTIYQRRHKLMLSFVVYQALRASEIEDLCLDDIDLAKGKVRLKEGLKRNGRMLELNPSQILPLNAYIIEERSRFNGAESNRLFTGSGKNIQMVFHQLIVNLQRINPSVKSLILVRSSVIHCWLQKHNLRKVQYWCGHRYVSSTEAYLDPMLKKLRDELGEFHPMGKL